MILSIAWKNIWRNKLRSLVVIFAVIIGILSGSIGVSIMEGMMKSRAKAQLNNEISHIQIHNSNFKFNNEAKYYIDNYDSIKTFISKLDGYKSSTDRLVISGLINSTGGNTAAFIYGIYPDIEKQVTEIYLFVKDSSGGYFNQDKKNQILISETTAKKLRLDRYVITDKTIELLSINNFPVDETPKLKTLLNIEYRTHKDFFNALRNTLDSKIVKEYEFLLLKYAVTFKHRANLVVTFQDINGKITGDRFRITGIYKTGNRMFDEMSVFVNKKDLSRLSGYKETYSHEIAVMLSDKDIAKPFAEKIKNMFPNLKVETWGEIEPMLIMFSEYMVIYNYLIILIILAALAFGIINTMLMAIMERTKELGMLAAVGMNKNRIFKMIMLETIFLTITGAIVGLVSNYFIIDWLSRKGIDLTKQMGEALEAMGFDSLIYPEMGVEYYFGITLLVIFVAILSSIYPAIKAIKLNPADAVRTDA